MTDANTPAMNPPQLPDGIRPKVRALALDAPTEIHLIGAGGAGMSAIGTVLRSLGHTVTGSDLKDSHTLAGLEAMGVSVVVGHAIENLADSVSVVARSTAIPDTNVEVVAALDRGLPVFSRAEILTAITRLRSTVAVAGTHGKTTTSSMLALILREGGLNPSFIIGAEVNEIGSGAAWDSGELLVVEADESDGTFLVLDAAAAIVTSVEPDHLDLYGDAATLEAAFVAFLNQVEGPRVVCVDGAAAAVVAELTDSTTYGTTPAAMYRITDFSQQRSGCTFTIEHAPSASRTLIELAAPGMHNAQNATAAFVCARELGVSAEEAAHGLARYSGVARRFEFRGEAAGVTFVDDYAHLPAEVDVTIDAATGGGWNRIVAVFQPHRFTRTAALGHEFADSFSKADLVVITDIYTAGEKPIPGVSGKIVADAIVEAHPDLEVVWLPHRVDLINYLRNELTTGDLCLTLGAGDLTSAPDELTSLLGGSQ